MDAAGVPQHAGNLAERRRRAALQHYTADQAVTGDGAVPEMPEPLAGNDMIESRYGAKTLAPNVAVASSASPVSTTSTYAVYR